MLPPLYIIMADPKFGPIKMIKVNLSDRFYQVWMKIKDEPQLGAVFPSLNAWSIAPPRLSLGTPYGLEKLAANLLHTASVSVIMLL